MGQVASQEQKKDVKQKDDKQGDDKQKDNKQKDNKQKDDKKGDDKNKVDEENTPEGIVDGLDGGDLDIDVYELTALYQVVWDLVRKMKAKGEKLYDKKAKKELKQFVNRTRWIYAYACFQAVICALSQIYGVIIILHYQLRDLRNANKKNGNKKFCNLYGTPTKKILSTLLQIFLFEYSLSLFSTNRGKSITYIKSTLCCICKRKRQIALDNFFEVHNYETQNKKIAHFIYNPYWVTVGVHINNLTFMLVSITSAFLIYSTNDPIDLILNCVALFFISEIDNLLVGEHDKKRLEIMFDWYRSIKYIPDKIKVEKKKDDDNKPKEQELQINENINDQDSPDKHSDLRPGGSKPSSPKDKGGDDGGDEPEEKQGPFSKEFLEKNEFKVDKACHKINGFYMDLYNYVGMPIVLCLWIATPIWNFICY